MLKRFLLFCGDHYYPSRAMGDFVLDFDTFDEAREHALKTPIDVAASWINIWDSQLRTIVFDYYYDVHLHSNQ